MGAKSGMTVALAIIVAVAISFAVANDKGEKSKKNTDSQKTLTSCCMSMKGTKEHSGMEVKDSDMKDATTGEMSGKKEAGKTESVTKHKHPK